MIIQVMLFEFGFRMVVISVMVILVILKVLFCLDVLWCDSLVKLKINKIVVIMYVVVMRLLDISYFFIFV